MKTILNPNTMSINSNLTSKHPHRFLPALVLTGILSLSASLTLVDAAGAAPQIPESTPAMVKDKKERSDRLPRNVERAVIRDLSQTLKIPQKQIRIVEFRRESWPNGCLGMPKPDEMCTQAIAEGWQVVASDGNQQWTYRTDNTGRNIRLFTSSDTGANLPKSIGDAVLRDLSAQLRMPINAFRIIKAEQQTWRDRCLGIYEPTVLCRPEEVKGWEVTVVKAQSERDRWVYRTNESGSVVKLAESNTQTGLKPIQIPTIELPPSLTPGVVFRAIASGGITGRTYETVLMQDGRVMQVLVGDANDAQRRVFRISRQQVSQFQRLLQKQNFSQFNRLSYPAPKGSADFITYTLTSQAGTTRYTDAVQEQLPPALLEAIQAWTQIANRTQS